MTTEQIVERLRKNVDTAEENLAMYRKRNAHPSHADYTEGLIAAYESAIKMLTALPQPTEPTEDRNVPRLVESVKGSCWEIHYQSRKMTCTEFDKLIARQNDVRCPGCGRSTIYCDCPPGLYDKATEPLRTNEGKLEIIRGVGVVTLDESPFTEPDPPAERDIGPQRAAPKSLRAVEAEVKQMRALEQSGLRGLTYKCTGCEKEVAGDDVWAFPCGCRPDAKWLLIYCPGLNSKGNDELVRKYVLNKLPPAEPAAWGPLCECGHTRAIHSMRRTAINSPQEELCNAFECRCSGFSPAEPAAESECVCGGSPSKPNPDCERCVDKAEIAQLRKECDELRKRVERLQEVIRHECCQCRFDHGRLVEGTECHYHECERCGQDENGDPNETPLSKRVAELGNPQPIPVEELEKGEWYLCDYVDPKGNLWPMALEWNAIDSISWSSGGGSSWYANKHVTACRKLTTPTPAVPEPRP